ncbi:MAG: hypothetical protein OXD46_02320 [Chloroflexi bacterium]|nr:hypothetical protein [Chloroflexota bacterium]
MWSYRYAKTPQPGSPNESRFVRRRSKTTNSRCGVRFWRRPIQTGDICPTVMTVVPRQVATAAPAALASLFAAIHRAARKAGLGDLGRKVEHLDRGLRGDAAAHDSELAAALQKDRAAQWGPGGRSS